jgi:hypothetical protein
VPFSQLVEPVVANVRKKVLKDKELKPSRLIRMLGGKMTFDM